MNYKNNDDLYRYKQILDESEQLNELRWLDALKAVTAHKMGMHKTAFKNLNKVKVRDMYKFLSEGWQSYWQGVRKSVLDKNQIGKGSETDDNVSTKRFIQFLERIMKIHPTFIEDFKKLFNTPYVNPKQALKQAAEKAVSLRAEYNNQSLLDPKNFEGLDVEIDDQEEHETASHNKLETAKKVGDIVNTSFNEYWKKAKNGLIEVEDNPDAKRMIQNDNVNYEILHTYLTRTLRINEQYVDLIIPSYLERPEIKNEAVSNSRKWDLYKNVLPKIAAVIDMLEAQGYDLTNRISASDIKDIKIEKKKMQNKLQNVADTIGSSSTTQTQRNGPWNIAKTRLAELLKVPYDQYQPALAKAYAAWNGHNDDVDELVDLAMQVYKKGAEPKPEKKEYSGVDTRKKNTQPENNSLARTYSEDTITALTSKRYNFSTQEVKQSLQQVFSTIKKDGKELTDVPFDKFLSAVLKNMPQTKRAE